MNASFASDDHDDDWTTQFIQEIEQWVRERYLCKVATPCVDAATPTRDADTPARQSAPLTYLPR